MRRIENCICPTHLGWQNAPRLLGGSSKSESPPPAPHCHAGNLINLPGNPLSFFVCSLRLCGSFIKPVAAKLTSPNVPELHYPDSGATFNSISSFWANTQPDIRSTDPPTIAVMNYPSPHNWHTEGEFQFAAAASLPDVGIYCKRLVHPDYSRQS